MEFMQILDIKCTNEDLVVILGVVRTVLNIVQFVIPIILIVLGIVDLSKAVTTSDEKATKEAQKRFLTRFIYAVVIFLVPTIVSLVFNLLPPTVFGSTGTVGNYSWKDCWDESGAKG